MRIVFGSGDNRHVFEVPTDRIGRERMGEDVKAFLRARKAQAAAS